MVDKLKIMDNEGEYELDGKKIQCNTRFVMDTMLYVHREDRVVERGAADRTDDLVLRLELYRAMNMLVELMHSRMEGVWSRRGWYEFNQQIGETSVVYERVRKGLLAEMKVKVEDYGQLRAKAHYVDSVWMSEGVGFFMDHRSEMIGTVGAVEKDVEDEVDEWVGAAGEGKKEV